MYDRPFFQRFEKQRLVHIIRKAAPMESETVMPNCNTLIKPRSSCTFRLIIAYWDGLDQPGVVN